MRLCVVWCRSLIILHWWFRNSLYRQNQTVRSKTKQSGTTSCPYGIMVLSTSTLNTEIAQLPKSGRWVGTNYLVPQSDPPVSPRGRRNSSIRAAYTTPPEDTWPATTKWTRKPAAHTTQLHPPSTGKLWARLLGSLSFSAAICAATQMLNRPQTIRAWKFARTQAMETGASVSRLYTQVTVGMCLPTR